MEIGSLVPEKKLKMFESLRPTNYDGQKQITKGHLNDSGNLRKTQKTKQNKNTPLKKQHKKQEKEQ